MILSIVLSIFSTKGVFPPTASVNLPLRRLVLAEMLPVPLTRTGATIAAGAALTALAAQVSVPVPGSPVPVTGQTFAVLLTAAALARPTASPPRPCIWPSVSSACPSSQGRITGPG
jgi:hypothetical protein